MRTVLTGVQLRPDGRVAMTFADRPGHRVTIVTDRATFDEGLAADIAAVVIPIITTRTAQEGHAS